MEDKDLRRHRRPVTVLRKVNIFRKRRWVPLKDPWVPADPGCPAGCPIVVDCTVRDKEPKTLFDLAEWGKVVDIVDCWDWGIHSDKDGNPDGWAGADGWGG